MLDSFEILKALELPHRFVQLCSADLGFPLSKAVIGKFSDGEINIQISESVRGKDNLPFYFKKVKEVLKTGGMFLLHSILCCFEGK
ncbi:ribose-phosphate pyrophosphokinase-like domain-containing protein, partial [Helicobacter pylori]|uniref:ribose-phosphate pyrophosphokinase-like domain-containing protein n=1 Tax=Helicobacter pylori TaxID=210 RepID=UPI001602A696